MNSMGDTLRSIAGDLDTNRSKSEASAKPSDTCTIQLVQDRLELEVLDEPVKQETTVSSTILHHWMPSNIIEDMESTRVDHFFVWLISLLIMIGALVTSIFVIILVNLKAKLRTTEKKLDTLTMAVTSQMNIIGDSTLKSIAGDIATDSTSMSNATRSSAKDTCTIQLVQDWLVQL